MNENKVVVITGGSQGIGKCIANEFAKEKYTVVICSRTIEDLKATEEDIKAKEGKCEAKALDVSDLEQVKEFFKYVMEKYKRIDVLINCAGIYGPIGELEKNDMAKWDLAIKVNLIGTVHCTYCAIPIMKSQSKGKIINMAGGGIGSKLKPNISAYITSKAAIVGFTEAISKELAGHNIQVNAISPGPVNTRLLNQVLQAGELSAGREFFNASKKQLLDGGVSPEKATKLALYLASSKADFVTGKILSAVWDDYENFDGIRDKLENSSLYNIRRIDNFMFQETKK